MLPTLVVFGREKYVQLEGLALEGILQILGQRCLTRDEFHTSLVEASAIVNCTPLWEVFSDPEAPQPLCPAMILTLYDSMPHPAPPRVFNADSLTDGKRLWRRAQYLADQIWTRWQKEYIQELQSRCKWRQPKKSLVIGDIVLLREKQLPRNHGHLGKLFWPIQTQMVTSDKSLLRFLGEGRIQMTMTSITSSVPFTIVFYLSLKMMFHVVPEETK